MKLDKVERLFVLGGVSIFVLFTAMITIELSLMARSVIVEETQLGLNAMALAAATEGCIASADDDVWVQARAR